MAWPCTIALINENKIKLSSVTLYSYTCTFSVAKMFEQCFNIKFCVMLSKNLSETLRMLKAAYGVTVMKQSAMFE